VNRDDRVLLADLGKLNRDVAPLAVRILDEKATAAEQLEFADRLADMAARLRARVARDELLIEGEVVEADHPQRRLER
jgi:hypothetical protein